MNVGETIKRLAEFDKCAEKPQAIVGFDGFIDRIAHRVAGGDGTAFDSMSGLGEYLVGRQERSSSFGLVNATNRPGGNMPNTALTLSQLGVPVTCVGSLGDPVISSEFSELAKRCKLISYANPGYCLAVEFGLGKIFFADNGGLTDTSWQKLVHHIGMDTLLDEFSKASAIGLFNWGEIPAMQEIWRGIAEDILPKLSKQPEFALFDTADLTRRSGEEVRELMTTLQMFKSHMKCVLSVNDGELNSISEKLNIIGNDTFDTCRLIQETGFMDALVLHSTSYAAMWHGGKMCHLATRFAEAPVLLTGGGDNFNAGLCLGLICGLSDEECLMTGNATSSLYVRNGRSSTMSELMEEIRMSLAHWQSNQNDDSTEEAI